MYQYITHSIHYITYCNVYNITLRNVVLKITHTIQQGLSADLGHTLQCTSTLSPQETNCQDK